MCQNRLFRDSKIAKCSSNPKHSWSKLRKVVDLVYLFYLFIWHFIFRWCLQVPTANKNQQNTIKLY